MLILGIESSCDETAAAVLRDGDHLLSNVINSQVAIHSPYGGVVPELASRKHLENIVPVVNQALADAGVGLDAIDCLAVTQGPGLIGALLVGLSFAKAISVVRSLPLVGVDHIAGHLLSPFLEKEKPEFPYIALVASGGHTSLFKVDSPLHVALLGRTRDDAAGEAFDKVAKLLGLSYPGGPEISRLAVTGNPRAIAFPRARLEVGSFDFSFSGLKTAVATHLKNRSAELNPQELADLCASFQEAVVEVLVEKTLRAAADHRIATVALAGGVAANPRLRSRLSEVGRSAGIRTLIPSAHFCTDNAAMIALAGWHRFTGGLSNTLECDAYSRSPLLQPGAPG